MRVKPNTLGTTLRLPLFSAVVFLPIQSQGKLRLIRGLMQITGDERTEVVVRSEGIAAGYYVGAFAALAVLLPVIFGAIMLVGIMLQSIMPLFYALDPSGQSIITRVASFVVRFGPVLFLLFVGGRIIYMIVRSASAKYTLTNLRLTKTTGLLTKNCVLVPLEQIQDVRLHMPLLGRLLGYGFVTVQTAGTTGEVTLRYVARPAEWLASIDAAARDIRQPVPAWQALGQQGAPNQTLLPGADLLSP